MALCTCHITNSTFRVLVVLTSQKEKNHVSYIILKKSGSHLIWSQTKRVLTVLSPLILFFM